LKCFGDSGTYENTINVWDLRTLDCIRTLPGHTGAVYALAIVGNKLFSGSYDATIRVCCVGERGERREM
jgi:F-box/WD-40 domain protein 7